MRFIRARWLPAGAALLALVLGASWLQAHRQHLLHPGDRIVPLHLVSLSGTPLTLDPPRRPQIINIFATWCEPCRAETPGLVAAAARLKAHGIDVVAIDQEESPGAVARFAREFSLPYPVYVDDTGVSHYVLGARMIPTTLYVDATGVIRWTHSGPISPDQFLTIAQARTGE
jgi:thiol-disulfide isomerase/thioredoxin